MIEETGKGKDGGAKIIKDAQIEAFMKGIDHLATKTRAHVCTRENHMTSGGGVYFQGPTFVDVKG